MITREKIAAAIVQPNSSMLDAVKAIDQGGIQAVLVASEYGALMGVATDGDVRRGILQGLTLQSPVSEVMNRQPAALRHPASREQAVALMNRKLIRQVPVLDGEGMILGAYHIDIPQQVEVTRGETWAVIMAGGRGTRLHPLTRDTPKPMLPIGGQPLSETIIRILIAQGCGRIYLAVNYMAEAFKQHFGDGSHFGAEIRYLEEDTPLGTAGALGLLKETPRTPILVMNGDLLTSVNIANLLAYHAEHGAKATMCVRDYSTQIPYGVIDMEAGLVRAIVEKPVKTYFVNAGIYVLDPSLLVRVAPGKHLDMTELLESVIAEGGAVSAFPIHEYWLDIGKLDDLERAQSEFHGVFNT